MRGVVLPRPLRRYCRAQVSSIFRSVRYVTRYHRYPGLVRWFESLFYAAKDEGIRHIYLSMHERNMRKVPRVFHKTQNNTHCALANQVRPSVRRTCGARGETDGISSRLHACPGISS